MNVIKTMFRSQSQQATFLKIMSFILYAWNDALSKQLSTDTITPIAPLSIVFIQYAIAALLLSPCFLVQIRGNLRLPTHSHLHLIRAVLCAAGIVILNQSFQIMPLSYAVGFNLLSPCLTIVCAYYFFHEALSQRKIIAILLSVLAYVVLLDSRHDLPSDLSLQACLLPSLAMLCFQANTLVTKQLTKSHETALNLTLSLFLMIPLLLYPLHLSMHSWPSINQSQMITLCQMAINGIVAALALHRAIASVELIFLIPFGFLKYSIISGFGFLYFSEIPSMSHSVGISITLCTLILLNVRLRRPTGSIQEHISA